MNQPLVFRDCVLTTLPDSRQNKDGHPQAKVESSGRELFCVLKEMYRLRI